MNAWSIYRLVRRQWIVVVLGGLATLGLVYGASQLVPAQQQFEANILLLPPSLTTEQGANPYLSLGGLENAAEIVGRAVMSEASIREVQSRGGTDDFTVELDTSSSGPLLLLTTTDATVATARLTMTLLLSQTSEVLERLQEEADVKPQFRITSLAVATQETPSVVRKSQIRAVLAAAALGSILTLFSAATIDSWARRRMIRLPTAPDLPPYGPADLDQQEPAESRTAPVGPAFTPTQRSVPNA